MSQNCASFIYRLRSSVERTALQNSVVVRMAAVLARVCVEIAFAGPVSVLASVNGPIEVRTRDELVDRATLEINIRPVSGPPGKLSLYEVDALIHNRVILPQALRQRPSPTRYLGFSSHYYNYTVTLVHWYS